jgi:serine/threonine protein kinase
MSSLAGYKVIDHLTVKEDNRTVKATTFDRALPVVIKTINNSSFSQPRTREQVRELIQRWSALHHPGLVQPNRAGFDHNHLFLVLPFIPAGNLEDRLHVGATSTLDIAQLSNDIADVLQHAHANGLVHGNIKPTNLLFDEEGQIHISDFLVTHPASGGDPTKKGADPDSDYIAPEVRAGSPPSPSSDQYALALILLTVMTRLPPQQALELLRSRGQDNGVPPIRALREGTFLPARVEVTFHRALATQPDKRFPSVAVFNRAFQQAMGFTGSQEQIEKKVAVAPPTATQLTPGRRTLRMALFMAATLSIVVTASALALGWIDDWRSGGDLERHTTTSEDSAASIGIESSLSPEVNGEASVAIETGGTQDDQEQPSNLPSATDAPGQESPSSIDPTPTSQGDGGAPGSNTEPTQLSDDASPTPVVPATSTVSQAYTPTATLTPTPSSTPMQNPTIHPNSCKSDPDHQRYCSPTPEP